MITNIQEEEEESNHTQFICSIKNQLNDIIINEPLLNDIIEKNLNLNELKNILSLEHGESIKVFIKIRNNEYINSKCMILFLYFFLIHSETLEFNACSWFEIEYLILFSNFIIRYGLNVVQCRRGVRFG